MTLIPCPDCQTRVSARALACPQCGYPFTGEVPAHLPARTPSAPESYLTTRFAVGATVLLGFTGIFGMAGIEEPGISGMAGVLAWGALIPLWWKTRKAARARAASGLLDGGVQQQLHEMEDRLHRELGEIESNTRRVTDLEERLEFTERLLTKYRDNNQIAP